MQMGAAAAAPKVCSMHYVSKLASRRRQFLRLDGVFEVIGIEAVEC
jgi:hypothetical protein